MSRPMIESRILTMRLLALALDACSVGEKSQIKGSGDTAGGTTVDDASTTIVASGGAGTSDGGFGAGGSASTAATQSGAGTGELGFDGAAGSTWTSAGGAEAVVSDAAEAGNTGAVVSDATEAVSVCTAVDTTDTDGDGIPDPCDADGDNDGFRDSDDPAPLDASVPGNFSTPKAIIADPRIQTALEGARNAGLNIVTHTELAPLNITGYYASAERAGSYIATGDGNGARSPVSGCETRITVLDGNLVDLAGIETISGGIVGAFAISNGNLLRGTAEEVTIYSRSRTVCTFGGANYVLWEFSITSETVEATTGNLINQGTVSVTIATDGFLTTGCRTGLVGNSELEGGWGASAIPLTTKVTADELRGMCVDQQAAYVPRETWLRTDGTQCRCTLDYAISCAN